MRHFLLAVVLALMAAAPAAATWREARTNHFVIYSEQGEKALRDFATKLERYDTAMRRFRKVPDVEPGPSNRLTIYVVSNASTVRRLYGDKSGTVGGFYLGRASGSIAIIPARIGSGGDWDMSAENVLLHEYAHHFLYQNYSGVYPAWFIEGFAEFHSAAKFEKDGRVGIGEPPLHRALGLLAGNPLPIEKMISFQGGALGSIQHEALYGRGWLLTHYLTFDPKRQGQIDNYLRLINKGRTSIEAAEIAFGDMKTLGRELEAYLSRRKVPYFSMGPRPIGPLAIRQLGPGEDAVMDAKIRSRRGVNAKQAQALLSEMRRLAAPFPNDPAVQATLAEAEYDAGNYAEAEAAADRALAADSKHMDALIYKAMARMKLADQSTDPKIWKEVRRLIVAANLADPAHATPLILFYHSYRRQGIAPTATAVTGLEEAFFRAPHDRSLRFHMAHQYLVDGKAKEARAALAPIAFHPHAGEAGAFAASVIALLDAGNLPQALQKWNGAREKAEADKEAEGEKGGGE